MGGYTSKEVRRKSYAKNAEKQRSYQLKKKYGITLDEYNALMEAQDNKCPVCDRHQDEFTRAFHVDHDHACCPGVKSCGKCVRGLICVNCNLALGHLGDSLERLDALSKYLLSQQNVLNQIGGA